MSAPIVQVAWNSQRIRSLPQAQPLYVAPEDGAPKGRKARRMAEWWKENRDSPIPGVIWMDPDIVADPGDVLAMDTAIRNHPEWVHVIPHKLWPASTGRAEWVWGHGRWTRNGPEMSQRNYEAAEWFSMGFTYTPRDLLDVAAPQMVAWDYGMCDMGLSRIAREQYINARSVYWAEVKHLHYVQGDDYLTWHGAGA